MPEVFLIISGMFLLMVGAFMKKNSALSITLLTVAAFVMALNILAPSLSQERIFAFDNLFVRDVFSQYVKVMILVASALVLIIAKAWLRHDHVQKFEFPVLVLFAAVGSMVMVSANDLLTLYMGLELSSLALYVLAAFDRDNARSSEAGLKYFVLGALASGMMLFGASLVYGYTGSTNFSAIAELFTANGESQTAIAHGAIVGMVLITVGLCFKISAVPFHMWTPDVYQGSPTAVTMLFATAPKIAALAVFIRVLNEPFAEMLPDWQMILQITAVLSMAVGAFGAMMQTSIKRLLAYGSIGHIGYALVGVAAGTQEGIQAVLIYLTLYLFMAIGTFGFILLMRRNGEQVEQLSDLAGLAKTRQRPALFLLVMMFSMAGIPPFSGFFGKMFIFLSAIEAGLYTLAIIGVLTSVVAAFYYLKVVKIMYFDEPKEPLDRYIPFVAAVVLMICALVTALFFLYPTPVLNAATLAAGSLVGGV
ncbi:MAG: NADH-quinone oxidoreductase subunit NuoN [Alphaproteobacteria bacterium]|nr:NADH-quinone oxidoreductase subunit NuoN [Alphaproteobacteria bacterium]